MSTVIPTERPRPDDAKLARAVGWVLRGGVLLCSALVLTGLVLFLVGNDSGAPKTLDEATGKSGAKYDVSVNSITHGLRHGHAFSFIELGLLVLLATPTVRVAITTWFLAKNRERVLTGMAIFVLAILLLGIFGIGA
jgi:uncharacterized membrane protein